VQQTRPVRVPPKPVPGTAAALRSGRLEPLERENGRLFSTTWVKAALVVEEMHSAPA